jgi:hypothetical protein
MTNAQKVTTAQLDAAPARFLDQFEELRMELSNEQLIAEAIEINHAGVGKEKTLERYRNHLVHYDHYLTSVHRAIPLDESRPESRKHQRWCDTQQCTCIRGSTAQVVEAQLG